MILRLIQSAVSSLTGKPRRHKDWAARSKAWLKGKTCAGCGECGPTLVPHHILPFTYYPELEMVEEYWIPLCEHPARNCHLNIGHAGDWKAFNPRVVEDAALMLKRRKERCYRRLEVVR